MPTKLLYDAAAIETSIAKLAAQIIANHTDEQPLFVALLRGAAPFASKLMFALAKQNPTLHPELDYMMVSTYGHGRTAGEPRVVTDLAPSTIVAGRTVIVLDDVLDKGVTAHFVGQHLTNKGARVVKLAVLIDKQTTRTYPVVPAYACLTTDDVWLAGMGMDDDATTTEAYRWRDEIFEIAD